jgi:hypothetical protein
MIFMVGSFALWILASSLCGFPIFSVWLHGYLDAAPVADGSLDQQHGEETPILNFLRQNVTTSTHYPLIEQSHGPIQM